MVELNKPFFIKITVDRVEYQLQVQCISRNRVHEQYAVIYGKHVLLFECNWPVYRHRNLKHIRPTWELVNGKTTYQSSVELITKAIENYVKKQ